MEPEIPLLLFMLFLSAFFSGAETAFMSVGILRARTLAKENKKAQLLLKLKENSRKLITTILICNNAVNISSSAIATVVATSYFGSAGIGIATGVMTFLVLIFGEIIPKNLAITHAEKIAITISRPISIIQLILYPLVLFFEAMTHICTKHLSPEQQVSIFSEEELRTMVEVGVSEQQLEENDKSLIEGVLKFNDLSAADVMTPRIKMLCLQKDLTVEQAYKELDEQNYSRLPIYDKDKDDIIGIVLFKDLIQIYAKDKEANTTLETISKKILTVHQSEIIDDVFKKFQRRRAHLAIVKDEHGGTAGLITMEDIIEEITGQIFDESDDEEKFITKVSKNKISVHPETEISEINDALKTAIQRPHQISTITGLLQHELKTTIHKDSKLKIDNCTITVEDIDEDNYPTKISIIKD